MELIVNLYSEKAIEVVPLKEGRIERVLPFEAGHVRSFIKKVFPRTEWADEISGPLNGPKTTVFVAIEGKKIVGFAAYDATAKDFFGPLGVDPKYRKKGYGEALCKACFRAMKEEGYAYAMIGYAGPVAWYSKHFGAVEVGNTLEESVYSRSFRK